MKSRRLEILAMLRNLVVESRRLEIVLQSTCVAKVRKLIVKSRGLEIVLPCTCFNTTYNENSKHMCFVSRLFVKE